MMLKVTPARLRLAVAAIVLILAPAQSWALTMPGSLVYLENYNAESTYPLSAEVDTIGAGGLVPFTSGNGIQSVIHGPTTVDASISGAAGAFSQERSAVLFNASTVGSADVGSIGIFNSLSLLNTGDALATTSVAAIYAGSAISTTFFHQNIGAVDSLGFTVVETDLVNGTTVNSGLIFVSGADSALVQAGGSYQLELVVDQLAATATGEVTIAGGGTYTSSALSLSLITGGLQGFGQFAGLTNFDPLGFDYGSNDQLSVSFDNFEVYAPAAVPEPSTALLMMFGLAALGVRRRRA